MDGDRLFLLLSSVRHLFLENTAFLGLLCLRVLTLEQIVLSRNIARIFFYVYSVTLLAAAFGERTLLVFGSAAHHRFVGSGLA